MNDPIKTEQFIVKAKLKHGDKYDYSLADYVLSRTNLKIVCSKHGVFEQSPNVHLRGGGCTQCATENKQKNKLTTPDVIAQFKKVHGDTYDYSKVEYVKNQKKVIIICSIHGEFEQTPNNHKMGKGCNTCAGRVVTKNEVLLQFKKAHGDRYDYSQFEYKGTDTKSKIICPEHGVFEQSPYNHKIGKGCSKCIGRHTTEDELITEFIKVHGDRYDYSNLNFVNKKLNINIICSVHGQFEQEPMKHANGANCPKCQGHGFSQDEVVEQFRNVHGDTYDYSKVNYRVKREKITIGCKVHGFFEQAPQSHLAGFGCAACSGNKLLTTPETVEDFKSIHGNKYDYSMVVYKGADVKVDIICREHGAFQQSPRDHKRGSGCTSCADYGFDYQIPAIMYYIKIDNGSAYKIGISNNSVDRRFLKSELKRIEVLKVWKFDTGKDAFDKEQEILSQFKIHKYKGEPLLDKGNTELFICDVLGLDKC